MPGVGLAERVVAVRADRGEGAAGGRYSHGSGCLVGGGTVLTAAHVITGAKTVTVRTADWAEHPARVDPAFVGDPAGWAPDHPPAPDLALLTLDTLVDVRRMPLARLDRDHPADVVDRVHSVGYPWFGDRDTPADETVRVQAPAAGQVLLSRREDGLLDFQVTIAPPPPPGGGSQWAGMSGAPVTAAGRLIGVITEHAPRKGPSTIAVIPLTALNHDPDHPSWGAGVGDPAAWWARLGVGDPAGMVVLPERREAPYRASLRELGHALHARMPQLLGREGELAGIAAFATGNQAYLWLVGGAYAGKTALAYEAVTTGTFPDTVDVVAYFLSRRASDASAEQFLNAVVPQFEVLLDWDHQTPDRSRFHQTWQEAAANAGRDGRHLLLVVDALDEDLHPAASPWVSDLLPSIVGPNAHVLVTSRPHPQIRDHIPTTHPLKTCPQVEVKPFPGAAELAEQATDEIYALAHGEDLDVDVLSLLTAAAGALSVADLAALHTHPEKSSAAVRRKVKSLLTERAARSLEPVGSHDAPRYQFAHDSLAEHARADPDVADHESRDRIHAWADTWAQAGWPDPGLDDGTGTPRYLLDTYPITLVGDPDHPQLLPPEPQRLAALAGDIQWIDTAIRALGVDRVIDVQRIAQRLLPTKQSVHRLLLATAAKSANLRPPHPVQQPGHVLRQLCFYATEMGMDGFASDLRERLSALPRPEFIPCATTAPPPPTPLAEFSLPEKVEVRRISEVDDGTVAIGVGSYGYSQVLVGEGDGFGTPAPLDGAPNSFPHVLLGTLAGGIIVTQDLLRDCVELWHTADPGDLRLSTLKRRVRAGSVDRAANRVALIDDQGEILLWRPEAPNSPLVVGRTEDAVGLVAVAGPASIITATDKGALAVWDGESTQHAEIGKHPGIRALTAHEGFLVTVGGDNVVVWNLSSGTSTSGELKGVRAVAVDLDGLTVCGTEDGLVVRCAPGLDTPPVPIGRHNGAVNCVAVLSDGRIASGGADGRALIWKSDAGQGPTPDASPQWVNVITGLSGDRVVTGGQDGFVRTFNVMPDGRLLEQGAAFAETGWVTALVAMSDGHRFVAGGSDGRLAMWDADAADLGKSRVLLGHHSASVDALSRLPDGRVASASSDGWLALLNVDAHEVAPLGYEDNLFSAIVALTDDRVLTCDFDGSS